MEAGWMCRLRRVARELKLDLLALLDRPRSVSVAGRPSGDHVTLYVDHGRVSESLDIPRERLGEVVEWLKQRSRPVSLKVEVYPGLYEYLVLPSWAVERAREQLAQHMGDGKAG